jgi:predicted HTH transcriptional regulator
MTTKLDEAALIALHSGNVKENLHLEYKASDAVADKSEKRKLEMARDVSAFANADGGQIIYGMKENSRVTILWERGEEIAAGTPPGSET